MQQFVYNVQLLEMNIFAQFQTEPLFFLFSAIFIIGHVYATGTIAGTISRKKKIPVAAI